MNRTSLGPAIPQPRQHFWVKISSFSTKGKKKYYSETIKLNDAFGKDDNPWPRTGNRKQ